MSNPGGISMVGGGIVPPSVHTQQIPSQQQIPPQQQRIPPNMNPQQLIYQQQQQQQQQQQLADEQKKLSDMIDGLNLLLLIRDDVNTILDNVAKANSANTLLASKANEISSSTNDIKKQTYVANTPQANQMSSNVPTPASVTQVMSQQTTSNTANDQEACQQDTNNTNNDELLNLDPDQVQFLQTTDTKFLQAKTEEISKNLK